MNAHWLFQKLLSGHPARLACVWFLLLPRVRLETGSQCYCEHCTICQFQLATDQVDRALCLCCAHSHWTYPTGRDRDECTHKQKPPSWPHQNQLKTSWYTLQSDRARCVTSIFANITAKWRPAVPIQTSVKSNKFFPTGYVGCITDPSVLMLHNEKVSCELGSPILNDVSTVRFTARLRHVITSCGAWWRFFMLRSHLHASFQWESVTDYTLWGRAR